MSAGERGPPVDRPMDPAAAYPLAAVQSIDTTCAVFGPSYCVMIVPLMTDMVTLVASGDWTLESSSTRRASSLACSSWAAASSTTAWEGAVAVATGPGAVAEAPVPAGAMAEGLGCRAENAAIATVMPSAPTAPPG